MNANRIKKYSKKGKIDSKSILLNWMQFHMLFYQKLVFYLILIHVILILLYYNELVTVRKLFSVDFSLTESSKYEVTEELQLYNRKESQNTNNKCSYIKYPYDQKVAMDLTIKSLTESTFDCKSIEFKLYNVKYDAFTRKTKVIVNATAVISHFKDNFNASSLQCSIERFMKKEFVSERLNDSISHYSSQLLQMSSGYEKSISEHG